jgi:hypothetical protein
MKSAILLVEGGIQVSRSCWLLKFLGAAAADRAFPSAANALAIGLVKDYRKSGEDWAIKVCL